MNNPKQSYNKPSSNEHSTELVPITESVVLSDVRTGGVFGLERKDSAADAHGQEVFNDVLLSLLRYIGTDKEAFLQLRDDERNVTLPFIKSEKITAQLHYTTEVDESSIISLTDGSARQLYESDGFHLTRSRGGQVTVVHATQEREWTPQDTDYSEVVDESQKHINNYLKQLDLMKSASILNVETPHEFRRALGVVSILGVEVNRPAWMGQRLLRKATRRSQD